MVRLGFGCCSGWPELLNRYVVPYVAGRPLVALHDQTSIAAAYNTILNHYAALDDQVDALILLHDDLEIVDPAAETKIEAALEAGADLTGVAGGSGQHGLAWWNHDPVGHQRTNIMNIDFGSRTGTVDLLEGSFMVFSPRAVHALRFDLRFEGFHGYDDIGMQANAAGMTVLVADVDTFHHTDMGFKTSASQDQWWQADRLFREKWGL